MRKIFPLNKPSCKVYNTIHNIFEKYSYYTIMLSRLYERKNNIIPTQLVLN